MARVSPKPPVCIECKTPHWQLTVVVLDPRKEHYRAGPVCKACQGQARQRLQEHLAQMRRPLRPPRIAGVISPRRLRLWIRDGGYCRYCGQALTLQQATVDHIHPTSRGGTDCETNLALACKPCNLQKGNRTLAEAGLVLRAPLKRALPPPGRVLPPEPAPTEPAGDPP